MIEKIRTSGLKGFDIDEKIPGKVIFTGPNKSGKTTRAGAIAIALHGHIPFSNAGKRPGDILDNFGNDSLVVSVTIDGNEFARKFSRNAKGSVSQSFQYDKKRVSSENFAIMLSNVGSPKIADVSEFMKQSEAKKVDTLFSYYPNEKLTEIDIEIETAKADVSRLEKKKSGAESTIQRLTNSKAAIQLPSGSIAETQEEIKSIESKIAEVQEQIKQAEIEEEKIKAAEEAKKEEAARIEREQQNKTFSENVCPPIPDNPEMVQIDKTINRMENQIDSFNAKSPQQFNFDQSAFKQSILRIIGALQETGCQTCAALIIAKQELKKYE